MWPARNFIRFVLLSIKIIGKLISKSAEFSNFIDYFQRQDVLWVELRQNLANGRGWLPSFFTVINVLNFGVVDHLLDQNMY